MNRIRALAQGMTGLIIAIMGVAAAGLLVRVFMWSAGL